MTNNKEKLICLIKSLNININKLQNSFVDNEKNFEENFDTRVRLQKIVYLLDTKYKTFEYNFSLYLRGPYSKDLSKDYFTIDENMPVKSNIPPEIIELSKKLNSKASIWLEIAATVKMMYIENPETAIERTIDFKSDILNSNGKDKSYVNNVYNELKEMKLF